MARKRMIDPGIWQSEDFSKLSMLERLLFIGMFSNADDEGRGRAKPIYLKSIIFPYEDMRIADIDKALDNIAHNMSVVFYTSGESEYYSLLSWNKWQKIDRPRDSDLPAFDDTCIVIRNVFDEQSTNDRRTFAPNRIEHNRIENKRKEDNRISLVEIYNRYCTNLSQCQKVTDKRKIAIDNFLKTYSLEQFEEICKKANITSFLIGKNDRKWKADIDFLLRIDKATSILEGKYDNLGKSSALDNLTKEGDLFD